MFSKFELTNDGVDLLNRVIAEKKTLKFTKFQLGKGDYEGDKKELSQLVDKFDEFNITQTNVLADGITNIRGFYDNRNLSIASKLTEIGIMAQLGDDSLTEVLFSYSNQPSADAETVPSKESYFSRTFSVMNKTDNVTSVTFDLTIRQDKYNFSTLEEMKSADYLDVGDKVTLWGNSSLGDSSVKMYIITDQTQLIQLNNKLYAKEYFKIVNNLTEGGTNNAFSAEQGKQLENKKLDKTAIVNDLTTGGTDKALSGQMGKELNENKFDKTGGTITGDVTINNSLTLKGGVFEFYGADPYIDFHQLGDEAIDYTVRLSCGGGTMAFYTKNGNNNYDLNTAYHYNNLNPMLGAVAPGLEYNNQYIQTNITKYAGTCYIDAATKKLYYCINTNNDTSVTANFVLATNAELAKRFQNFSYQDLTGGGVPCSVGTRIRVGNLKDYTFLNVSALRDGTVWVNTTLFAKYIGGAYSGSQFICDEAYFLRGSYDGEYITINENGGAENRNNVWTSVAFTGIKLNV